MFFFLKRLPFFKEKTDSLHERSALGQTFGWWLCFHGERIAELNYLGFDVGSQSWHEYSVRPLSPAFEQMGYEPERWATEDISLQSRYAQDYRTSDFLMSPRKDNVVAIRGANVPKAVFDNHALDVEDLMK